MKASLKLEHMSSNLFFQLQQTVSPTTFAAFAKKISKEVVIEDHLVFTFLGAGGVLRRLLQLNKDEFEEQFGDVSTQQVC